MANVSDRDHIEEESTSGVSTNSIRSIRGFGYSELEAYQKENEK